MEQQDIMDIIANALLDCDKVDYIVRLFHGKGLQIQTSDKRHYNLVLKKLDKLKDHIVQIRHEIRNHKEKI